MKYTIIALLFIGCGQPTTSRFIPQENIGKADSFIVRQMQPLVVSNRNDDEDYDDFLFQAKRNALDLYGRDTVGWWDDNGFTPYALCTESQKREIMERLNAK